MEKVKKQNKDSYLFMAIAFGIVLGSAIDKVGLGLICGFLIGLYLDKKKNKEIKQESQDCIK